LSYLQKGEAATAAAGLGSGISLTTSCSLDICTSSSLESRGNSSSRNAEVGGHPTITTLRAGGGGAITALTAVACSEGGGNVLGIKAGLGGRSVGTSKLDDESETIKVDDVGGGYVTIDKSSVVGGSGGDSPRVSTTRRNRYHLIVHLPSRRFRWCRRYIFGMQGPPHAEKNLS
jgi:hypothetical protein